MTLCKGMYVKFFVKFTFDLSFELIIKCELAWYFITLRVFFTSVTWTFKCNLKVTPEKYQSSGGIKQHHLSKITNIYLLKVKL